MLFTLFRAGVIYGGSGCSVHVNLFVRAPVTTRFVHHVLSPLFDVVLLPMFLGGCSPGVILRVAFTLSCPTSLCDLD